MRSFVVSVVFLVAILALGVIFRTNLAEGAIARWCDSKGLSCAAQVTDLSTDRVSVSGVRISSGSGVPFEADEITAELTWPGFLMPSATHVVVRSPIVRAVFDGKTVTAYGLEDALPSGGGDGGGGALPSLDISDAVLILDTPAGSVTGDFRFLGQVPGAFEARLVLQPATLEQASDRLNINAAAMEVAVSDEGLRGGVNIDIPGASLGETAVDAFQVTMEIAPDGDGTQIIWSGRADDAAYGATSAKDVVFDGLSQLGPVLELTREGLQAALEQVAAEIRGANVQSGALSMETVRFETSLSRNSDGLFAGPLVAAIGDVSDPLGKAKTVTFAGDIGGDAQTGEGRLGGRIVLVEASVADDRRAAWLAPVKAPTPFKAHGAALQSALSGALSGFDAEAAFLLTAQETGWRVESREPALLTAASGFEASVSPAKGRAWLTASPGQVSLSGEARVAGGGAPRVSLDVGGLSRAGGDTRLEAGPVSLAPWRVAGLKLAADLPAVSYNSEQGASSFAAQGTLTLDGRLTGVTAGETRLSGAVTGTSSDGALSVRTADAACLSLKSDGLSAGVLEIGTLDTDLCPVGGVLLDGPVASASGQVRLANAVLPISTRTVRGDLAFGDAMLNWRAERGVDLTLTANTLAAPLTVSGRSLETTGSSVELKSILGRGDPKFSLSLEEAIFAGALIPADVSAGSVALDLTSTDAGLQGRGAMENVGISDFRDDPIYQPLAARFDATITDGRLSMTGPITLETRPDRIATATLDLDVASLTGVARVQTTELTFMPGGLQPLEISERLRGLFTDANGQVRGEAVLRITGGKLAGQGTATVSDFGFQTQALGRVTGVKGVILFDDLIAVTTPPGQTVTISSIDPGLPLQSGRIQFQVLGPSETRLETATWPFAGGVLRVEPTVWRLGETERKVTVSAEKVELAALVEALAAKDIEAQGTVSGAFPIEFDGSNVYINNARFIADQKGGVLRYTGPAARQAANTNESVALAFDALENLEYSVLEIGADGNVAGNVVISLNILGRNPEVLSGAPFQFNVSVDSELGKLLQSGRSLTSSDWLAEAVVKQVTGEGEQP